MSSILMPQSKPSHHRWQSNEESNFCAQCNDAFSFVNRRHHCRVCGKLFCAECSSNMILIPIERMLNPPSGKVDNRIPHRSCSSCARILLPIQNDLRILLSKANSENIIERDCSQRYMNLPISFNLENEIKKASYTLLNFTADNIIEGKDRIPRELLIGAKGIAFLTVGKLGFFVTGRFGTGLVISRLKDGSWSAPCSIMVSGVGWGLQIGGEVADVILILNTTSAVEAFKSRAQISVGTELCVSLGPVGRSTETDLHAGNQGIAAAFSYAHCKGLFVGISLEASIIAVRPDVNRAFYGLDVPSYKLLSGEIARPLAAEPLYRALSEVLVGDARDQLSPYQNMHSWDHITPDDLLSDPPPLPPVVPAQPQESVLLSPRQVAGVKEVSLLGDAYEEIHL